MLVSSATSITGVHDSSETVEYLYDDSTISAVERLFYPTPQYRTMGAIADLMRWLMKPCKGAAGRVLSCILMMSISFTAFIHVLQAPEVERCLLKALPGDNKDDASMAYTHAAVSSFMS